MRIVLGCLLLVLFGSCKDGKRYHKADTAVTGSAFEQHILEHWEEVNAFFRNPETSPLPDRYRADFESLDFFSPDSSYRVRAALQRTPDAKPFLMPTTTDRTSPEKVFGLATFILGGQEYTLRLYESASRESERETLFLPFTDATNGKETYAGGRYIDLQYPRGDSLTIDFNKAYNPYCVYNKKFSCPLVPRENDLPVPIPAGVKMFNPKK